MVDNIQHIVITGASSGIGEALARAYAADLKERVQLTLSGRNKDRLLEVVEACRAAGAACDGRVMDVVDRKGMEVWLREIDAVCPVDLIIANAGISGGTGQDELEGRAQIDAIMAVNFDGVLNSISPLIEPMMARKSGQIAIMASLAGYRGFPGAPAYCASKAAARVYGESLRGSLRGHGVDVSVICPGFVVSRMTDVNEFPMPFLMSAEKAARIIIGGLRRRNGRIAFPFRTAFMAWALMAMPEAVSSRILKGMPAKSSHDGVVL